MEYDNQRHGIPLSGDPPIFESLLMVDPARIDRAELGLSHSTSFHPAGAGTPLFGSFGVEPFFPSCNSIGMHHLPIGTGSQAEKLPQTKLLLNQFQLERAKRIV